MRNRILGASAEVERSCGQDLRQSRQSLTGSVNKLQAAINDAVINRIIQDLADISSPLKPGIVTLTTSTSLIAVTKDLHWSV